jgi:hypothetical protein
MPVPDQVRDDGSGIQNILNLLDSGFRRNDRNTEKVTYYETVIIVIRKKLLEPVLFGLNDEH